MAIHEANYERRTGDDGEEQERQAITMVWIYERGTRKLSGICYGLCACLS